MTDFLGKKYRVESKDNIVAYMEAIGVNEQIRKIAATLVISVQLFEQGGTFTFKTCSDLRNVDMVFQNGVEFEEKTQDGRVVKSTITVTKNKMVQLQKHANIDSRIERTFSGDGLETVLTAGNVVSTLKFKLVD